MDNYIEMLLFSRTKWQAGLLRSGWGIELAICGPLSYTLIRKLVEPWTNVSIGIYPNPS